MDLVKTISALGFAITMLSFAVMLGRILQGLDDLKKKVDVSLDPEKGTVKELRERTHETNNKLQEIKNANELLKQAFLDYKREVAREIEVIKHDTHVDEQLEQIKGTLRARTPGHGISASYPIKADE